MTIVESIQKFIQEKRNKHNIVNQIIRDDVFELLGRECTVLYYFLEDTIEGFHIERPVNGELRQFVFINTKMVLQEQVWTAGHELGHVWKVDQYVRANCIDCKEDIEKIIGMFTAELLMPCDSFKSEVRKKLEEYHYEGNMMPQDVMIDLVTYLMNYFVVPAKAVIIRFCETGYIREESIEDFLKGFEEGQELFNRIITEKQYTRINNVNEVYSIGTISEDIAILEKNEIVKAKYAKRVKEMFHIDDSNPDLQNRLEFRG